MGTGQKLWIFYWWPIFESVPFFPQTLHIPNFQSITCQTPMKILIMEICFTNHVWLQKHRGLKQLIKGKKVELGLVADPVIEATVRLEFEDGLRTGVPEACWYLCGGRSLGSSRTPWGRRVLVSLSLGPLSDQILTLPSSLHQWCLNYGWV